MSNKSLIIEKRLRGVWKRVMGWVLRGYLYLHNCKVGKGLKCYSWPMFRSVPDGNISMGDSVTIGKNVSFDVHPDGRLTVGNNVNLTQDIIIASKLSVSIGDDVLVAERVSIRDADHGVRQGRAIFKQELIAKAVVIENDVWLGAGVCVLKGSYVSRGAVIGANSVVIAKSNILPYRIYVGSPVVEVGVRSPV